MMYSEFYDRTKTDVSAEEYHYIEESYYDFDRSKDDFYKQWKKDAKSGKWELEYRLRKTIDDQKAEYEAKLAEQEEALKFYRGYTPELKQKLDGVERHLRAILNDIHA